MNRKFIRLISLIITVTLLGSFVIGCQDEDKDKTTDESNSLIERLKTGNNSHAALKFASFDWAPTKTSKKVFDEISNQSAKYLNNSIEYEKERLYPTGWRARQAFANIKDADAFIAKGNISEIIADSSIMDLTSLLPEYVSGYYAKCTQSELDRVTFDGRIMGIPMHFGGSGRLVAVVREDLLELSGMKEINTLDDYTKFMDLIKENGGDVQYPGLAIYDTAIFMQQFGYAGTGGELVYKVDDPSMKLKPLEQTDEYLTAVKTITDWYLKGYFPPYLNLDKIEQRMKSNNLGSFVLYWDDAKSILRTIGSSIILKVFPLYPYAPSAVSSVENTYSIVINKDSKNAARVLRFLEWVNASQENYDLVMYGVKGKDYELQEGRVKLFNGDSEPPYYLWGVNQVFYNENYDRPLAGEASEFEDLCNRIETLDSLKQPASGFIPYLGSDIGELMANREYIKYLYDWTNHDWSTGSVIHFGWLGISGKTFISPKQQVDFLIDSGKYHKVEKLVLSVQRQLDKWLENRKKQ